MYSTVSKISLIFNWFLMPFGNFRCFRFFARWLCCVLCVHWMLASSSAATLTKVFVAIWLRWMTIWYYFCLNCSKFVFIDSVSAGGMKFVKKNSNNCFDASVHCIRTVDRLVVITMHIVRWQTLDTFGRSHRGIGFLDQNRIGRIVCKLKSNERTEIIFTSKIIFLDCQ